MNNISEDLIRKISSDQKVRQTIAQQSLKLFFSFYLGNYIKYPSPDFHEKIFHYLENEEIKKLGIVAFRGSAKSTIVTLAYPLWAILGKQQKKFVLIVGKTQDQARQFIKNIKEELESNDLLKVDLGPFQEPEDEWRSFSLVIPQYNARITAVSIEQSIRGIRHKQYRPDLIICDDIEDLASVRTLESRDKTYQWINSELSPAGDISTRFIIVGNLLHQDSVLMRFKNDFEGKKGHILEMFPLLDEKGKCLWPGKYPSEANIDEEKLKIGNEVAWQREYILRIISEEGQVVRPEWIQYYEKIPVETKENKYRFTKIGVDLAISKEESADYTAMVPAIIFGYGENIKIYILPNIIEKRLSCLETLDEAELLSRQLEYKSYRPEFIVEDVAYQRAFIEQLQNSKCLVKGFRPQGDKRARLIAASSFLQRGNVFFPKQGAEKLIQQLVGFGSERHDDLVDAFSSLLIRIMELRGSSDPILPTNINIEPRKHELFRWNGWGDIMHRVF